VVIGDELVPLVSFLPAPTRVQLVMVSHKDDLIVGSVCSNGFMSTAIKLGRNAAYNYDLLSIRI